MQKVRTEEGDVKSHSSAYICSFEASVRKRSIRIDTFSDSMGSGERAMTCAPRWASDWRMVKPRGVKPPYNTINKVQL